MTKAELYDEVCRALTEYETGDANAEVLYGALVDVQNNWDTIKEE